MNLLIFYFTNGLLLLGTITAAFDDEDLLSAGSGSGYIPLYPPANADTVPYKSLDVKFATKHKFSNQPSSDQIYTSEVCDAVVHELNPAREGPMPGMEHRPAIVTCDTLRATSEPDAATAKFRAEVKLPAATDVDEFLARIQATHPFFTMLKRISPDSVPPEEMPEQQLVEYEQRMIPHTATDIGIHDPAADSGGGGGGGPNQPQQPSPPPGVPGGGPIDTTNTNVVLHYPRVRNDFFRSPATLAAIVAAAVAGLFCTVLCTVFVVYRMRKKDEGSYALDEPKKYKHEIYIPSTKEFFA